MKEKLFQVFIVRTLANTKYFNTIYSIKIYFDNNHRDIKQTLHACRLQDLDLIICLYLRVILIQLFIGYLKAFSSSSCYFIKTLLIKVHLQELVMSGLCRKIQKNVYLFDEELSHVLKVTFKYFSLLSSIQCTIIVHTFFYTELHFIINK